MSKNLKQKEAEIICKIHADALMYGRGFAKLVLRNGSVQIGHTPYKEIIDPKKPKENFMTPEQFKEVFEARVEYVRKKLFEKSEEYSRNGNVFHNFHRAAAKRNVSVFEALLGMEVKHDVSIDDIVNDLKAGKTVSVKTVNAKLGDKLAYYFLLDGLLAECPQVLPAELPEWARKLTKIFGVGPLSPEAAKKKLKLVHRYKRGKGGRFAGSVKKKK